MGKLFNATDVNEQVKLCFVVVGCVDEGGDPVQTQTEIQLISRLLRCFLLEHDLNNAPAAFTDNIICTVPSHE